MLPPSSAAFWAFTAPVAEPREVILDDPFDEGARNVYEPHELDPPPAPEEEEEPTRSPRASADDEDQEHFDENFEKDLEEMMRNTPKPPPGSGVWGFREDASRYGRRGGGGPPAPRPWAPEPEYEPKRVKTKTRT